MAVRPQNPLFQPAPKVEDPWRKAGQLALVPVLIVLLVAIVHLLSVVGKSPTAPAPAVAQSAAATPTAPPTSAGQAARSSTTADLAASTAAAQAHYSKEVIWTHLHRLMANVPPHASIRSIGMIASPQLTATVVEGDHARTYTDASSEGFPRALTRRLRAARALRLDGLDATAPARMVAEMISGTDRSVDGWSSLEFTAGKRSVGHWTAVWVGEQPTKFRADTSGDGVKLVSGTWR